MPPAAELKAHGSRLLLLEILEILEKSGLASCGVAAASSRRTRATPAEFYAKAGRFRHTARKRDASATPRRYFAMKFALITTSLAGMTNVVCAALAFSNVMPLPVNVHLENCLPAAGSSAVIVTVSPT